MNPEHMEDEPPSEPAYRPQRSINSREQRAERAKAWQRMQYMSSQPLTGAYEEPGEDQG